MASASLYGRKTVMGTSCDCAEHVVHACLKGASVWGTCKTDWVQLTVLIITKAQTAVNLVPGCICALFEDCRLDGN